MKNPGAWIAAIVLLWIAGGSQESLAYQLSIASATPDYLLVVVTVLSLFGNRRSGAIVGFIGGLLSGAIAGGHMAAYTVTRTLIGFLIGWLNGLEFEGNFAVAFVVTSSATLCVQLTFFFMNPRGAILPALLATIGSAMYNGVLAMPLYALLKKVLDSPKH